MNQPLPFKRVLFIIALLFSLNVFSQLPAFTFGVTPVNETCLNNGSLTFAVSGTQPGATMSYAVYLLPNATTPVTTTTSTSVSGLGAGSYSITATQTLNAQTSTNTKQVQILDLKVPLTFTLSYTPVMCGTDATITANVTSGNPVSYEISAGPVIKPLQTSNVFTGLPAGLYSVRVFDNCNNAQVVSVTVTTAITGVLIGTGAPDGASLTSCSTIDVVHKLVIPFGGVYFNPLTVEVTVFPPGGGAPIIITQTVTADSAEYDLTINIPFYNNQPYSYNIKITDACGNTVIKNSNPMLAAFNVVVEDNTQGCGDNFFTFYVGNYSPPYTINFTSAPAGFNAVTANPAHPTFTAATVDYGLSGTFVPEGNYIAVVTDACGRSVTVPFTVQDSPVPAQIIGQDVNCVEGGKIRIRVTGRDVVDVDMTACPVAYFAGPFPKDMNEFIVDGEMIVEDLPSGLYKFTATDECGEVTDLEYEVVFQGSTESLTILQRPGCGPGEGSVRIVNSQTDELIDLFITAAPAAFNQPLPADMSSFINTGDKRAYINTLPAGTYTFQSTTICGDIITRTVALSGYTITTNNFTVVPHCGAFDLQFQHVSNGTFTQTFYLQKFNSAENTWEHPQTGLNYTEGTPVNINNGIPLTNNGANLSYPFTGLFRVIKTFFVYDNGSFGNIRCYDVLYTFTYDGGPVIKDTYSFPCEEGLTDVAVIAEGVPPLTYSITSKDGQPFLINNGASNYFNGLEEAIYNLRVTDVCGNIRNVEVDIDALDPLSITADGFCEGQAGSLSIPGFDFIDYKWWKEGAPGVILSESPILTFPAYNSATQSGTYYVSIMTDNPLSCVNQTFSFTLEPNGQPDAGADTTVQYCNDGVSINLNDYLAAGIATNGEWEDTDGTGMLNNSTLTTAPLAEGTYHFKYTITGLCDLTDDAILTFEFKNIPAAPVVTSNSPLCEGSDITLSATTVPGVTYQWTGPNGFTSAEASPVLSNVGVNASGAYILNVTANGCASPGTSIDIVVNASPKAGDDNAVQLCNDGTAVDLTDFLLGVSESGGIWEDTDGTGTLDGSVLSTSGVAAGAYNFKYTVTNSCNTVDEAIITVALKDIPQPPAVAAIDPLCEGSDIQLSAQAVTDAVYSWTGPGGFSSAEQNPLLTGVGIVAAGEYRLTVTVNDCTSDAAIVPVTVMAMPQFSIDGNTVICEGQVTELIVEPVNFNAADVDFAWYLDGAQLGETSATINVSQTGQYEVVVDNNSCTTILQFPVTLNDNAFELVLDSGCIDYEYRLWVANASDIPGAVISWKGPNNFSASGSPVNITNLAGGDYIATVTNNEGCSADATITIHNTSCIIPRGISPNGDGLNDSFDLSNLDVREIKIFNRYGLKVYEAKNYKAEWHGQSDKGTLPTATYYYVITLSAGKQVTGWVYLQREE